MLVTTVNISYLLLSLEYLTISIQWCKTLAALKIVAGILFKIQIYTFDKGSFCNCTIFPIILKRIFIKLFTLIFSSLLNYILS